MTVVYLEVSIWHYLPSKTTWLVSYIYLYHDVATEQRKSISSTIVNTHVSYIEVSYTHPRFHEYYLYVYYCVKLEYYVVYEYD